jgi:hypothetical protein
MTALAATHPTLLDVTKGLAPDGAVDKIAEILSQTNEILDDMVLIECNDGTGHRSTIRAGLPAPTWRKLYGGVQPTKSTKVQVTDSCGMLEAYAEVDKALADLNGNTKAFRLTEDTAHIEGMGQELTATLFYGSETTEPEAFTGFGPRFNDQSAANGDNILTEAATPDGTDNSSIWLIVWGPDTVHGIYPKGSVGGLQMTDKGQVTIGDQTNGYYEGYRSHYRWDIGLVVRDWRYVVRINFDSENLVFNAATGPNLPDLMAQATELIPSLSKGRPAFYMNRKTRSFLRRQIAAAVSNSTLTMDKVGGKKVMFFDEIPVRRCDAITNTEAGI